MYDCVVGLMEVWLKDMCSSNPSAILRFLTVYFDTPGATFVQISSINALTLHCINQGDTSPLRGQELSLQVSECSFNHHHVRLSDALCLTYPFTRRPIIRPLSYR